MTPAIDVLQLIIKINSSRGYIDVFSDLSRWTEDYKDYAKLLHPDRCNAPGAPDAMARLNMYKDELSTGKQHNDDAGVVTYTPDGISIDGTGWLLERSVSNYKFIMSLHEKIDVDFQRYVPRTLSLVKDDNKDILKATLGARCLPLSAMGTLPQGHVNWILSRMLEFAAYLNQKGLVHAGFNPDSVYIEPVNHGIRVISYYHMARIGETLKTASGRYINFYPDHVRVDKIATPDIDIELAKRTAVYLLGDRSGIGNVLRKTGNPAFLDFISKRHKDPLEAYQEYRQVLKNNFESKFVPLNV